MVPALIFADRKRSADKWAGGGGARVSECLLILANPTLVRI